MKLEQIGFYTLSDNRALHAGENSPIWRCEMILTGKCNFKCPYCRGTSVINGGKCDDDMDVKIAEKTLEIWIGEGLKNIRFSGGEPTLYPHLKHLVDICRNGGVEKIAVSTNGSMPFGLYLSLIDAGVNDFSISLDSCCASFGNKMSGTSGKWKRVVANIALISKITYVTVGVVLTEDNVDKTHDIIVFAHHLGVADIRIVSAAQYNKIIDGLVDLPQEILDAHPILKYRAQHFREGRNVRGIQEYDTNKCYLVRDDSVVSGKWHFPCVINMREGGKPIGKIGPQMRKKRMEWFKRHNTFEDPICRQNCLDVCIDYNNKCARFLGE